MENIINITFRLNLIIYFTIIDLIIDLNIKKK